MPCAKKNGGKKIGSDTQLVINMKHKLLKQKTYNL